MGFFYVPVKTANKEPASKPDAPKKQRKGKKTEKTKEVVEIEPEPDVSEVSATSKRRRKPPGEWWLTQHDEGNTHEQQEALQSSQERKFKRQTQKKASVLTDSAVTPQEIQNERVTVQKLPKKVKKSQAAKSQSNPARSQENPKAAGGRLKTKPKPQDQRELTPALSAEEEAGDNEVSGQPSPVACGRLPREPSMTPGNTGRLSFVFCFLLFNFEDLLQHVSAFWQILHPCSQSDSLICICFFIDEFSFINMH